MLLISKIRNTSTYRECYLVALLIINWLHSLGGAKGVKSQPIWGVVCYMFSAGNRAMHLEDLRGCLDDNGLTFAWAWVHSGSLSWLYICLHDTPQNIMPAWVTPAWAHPGCCTRARISLRYHVNAKKPLVLVWNRSAGRLEQVAHALFLWFWITHVFYQREVYLQIIRYEMTQSSSGLLIGASSRPKLPARVVSHP